MCVPVGEWKTIHEIVGFFFKEKRISGHEVKWFMTEKPAFTDRC